ncbi:MAG TPA: Mur ligase family protein [Rubricoccaceae bacterium]|jgi:dihydrofolate synthase/folylpolyglutamate synthase
MFDLFALPRFADAGSAAYRPGLDRMHALLEAMGHPERACPSVHIAGTNGKGSTSSFVAAIATAAGLNVGLHTSPHLVALGERMRVGGVPASDDWIAAAAERHAGLFARVGPSFFEATTALAFFRFAEAAVDLAVVEVGLGGRLDATNVLMPVVSVVTSVGLDHTDLLGETLPEIAREKAGIARSGVPLLHAVDDPAARAAIEDTARAAGAPPEAVRETCRVGVEHAAPLAVSLATPWADYGRLNVGLPGAHQAWNAALAVRAAEIAIPSLTPDAVASGLMNVARLSGLRGRGEHTGEGIVLDVAHNDDGWRVALASAAPDPPGRLFALVGMMADKDAAALAQRLVDAGAVALPVGLPGDRALGRDALSAVLQAGGVDVVDGGETVAEALAWFRAHRESTDRLLVTGSHVTVASALSGGTL